MFKNYTHVVVITWYFDGEHTPSYGGYESYFETNVITCIMYWFILWMANVGCWNGMVMKCIFQRWSIDSGAEVWREWASFTL
jgi:hypothetical protein